MYAFFCRYLQKYNKEEHREDERVGFMDPMKTNEYLLDSDAQSKEFVEKYIKDSLRENRRKKLIFIPYHQLLVLYIHSNFIKFLSFRINYRM